MRFPADIDKVCSKAMRIWGTEAQEAMAVGEIGELLTLFGRRAQGRATSQEWVDEISDCIMMLHQLAHLHGNTAVEFRVAEKLEKLKARLKKYECSGCDGAGVVEHSISGDNLETCLVCQGTGRRPGQ